MGKQDEGGRNTEQQSECISQHADHLGDSLRLPRGRDRRLYPDTNPAGEAVDQAGATPLAAAAPIAAAAVVAAGASVAAPAATREEPQHGAVGGLNAVPVAPAARAAGAGAGEIAGVEAPVQVAAPEGGGGNDSIELKHSLAQYHVCPAGQKRFIKDYVDPYCRASCKVRTTIQKRG